MAGNEDCFGIIKIQAARGEAKHQIRNFRIKRILFVERKCGEDTSERRCDIKRRGSNKPATTHNPNQSMMNVVKSFIDRRASWAPTNLHLKQIVQWNLFSSDPSHFIVNYSPICLNDLSAGTVNIEWENCDEWIIVFHFAERLARRTWRK